jgi:hypothetical protein
MTAGRAARRKYMTRLFGSMEVYEGGEHLHVERRKRVAFSRFSLKLTSIDFD